jgi:hypothetical protein
MLRAVNEIADKLKAALGKPPHGVSRVLTKIGTDSTGDPAVWIWIILPDSSFEDASSSSEHKKLREWAANAVRASGVQHWPYVFFRSEAEQTELENSVS